jgi:hypothetical protein
VILAPKLSEFLILSIHAFIHNNCLLHLYLFVYCLLALENSMPEPPFEDFHEQVFEYSEVFFSRKQGKCFSTMLHLSSLSIL